MTHETLLLTILVIVVALAFDFVNGFHDAANSIATIVATKVLKPWHAVLWAAFFNFIAIFFFGTGVAKMVGSGMIDLDSVTPIVILAGLLGAIVWGLMTWWLRMPTSSSHALLGGYSGAAICNSILHKGWGHAYQPIIAAGWYRTLVFIVVAPVLGMVLAQSMMKLTLILQKKFPSPRSEKIFRRMQLFSSAFLSLMHGSNDAQKTAGIIAGVLAASHYTARFEIPFWVLGSSYGMMGLGTLVGGWRIVDTLGNRITRIKPNGGFCAETSAALSILLATTLELPVSTTQVVTGAIIGVGAARNVKAVRWNVAGHIFWSWIFTIPVASALGAGAMAMAYVLSL